jgi:hypothetical protein
MGIIFYVLKGWCFLFSVAVFMAGVVVFARNMCLREILGNLGNYVREIALHLSLLNSPDMNGILFDMPCQLRNVNEH